METTQLTPEEEVQLNKEFAELSGTSDSTEENVQEVEETEEQTFDEEFEESEEVEAEKNSEETEEDEESDEETSKESKTEKKIKKLLSKKNKAEREKQSLEERLAELEKKEEINDFIVENPDAKNSIEIIQNLMEEKGYEMEDAYLVLKARGEIKTVTPKTNSVGTPKQGLGKPKSVDKMSISELEAMLKANPDAHLI